MKMFLTRIGFGSKAVVTGDITQVDLPNARHSGLRTVISILRGVRGIAFTLFTSRDVVRHPLVQRIVQAYEAFAGSGPVARPRGPRRVPARRTEFFSTPPGAISRANRAGPPVSYPRSLCTLPSA